MSQMVQGAEADGQGPDSSDGADGKVRWFRWVRRFRSSDAPGDQFRFSEVTYEPEESEESEELEGLEEFEEAEMDGA